MNSRLVVGIIAQQSYTIGLFEIFFLVQPDRRERVAWIKPYRSPFSEWVRPQAIMEEDPVLPTMIRESVDLLCADFLRMDRAGRISSTVLTPATLLRIPYVVSFWEQTDLFPVFTLYPDHRLPWSYTTRAPISVPRAQPRDLVFRPRPLAAAPATAGAVAAPTRTAVVGELEEDAICPISMEPLVAAEAVWTPCGHAFSCLLAHALERDARCPLCRAPCEFSECAHPE
jgi:hypothetical protein